jgi:hypothetical protein
MHQGDDQLSHGTTEVLGRVIHAVTKAMAAATDSHAPGIARLPVSWIR